MVCPGTRKGHSPQDAMISIPSRSSSAGCSTRSAPSRERGARREQGGSGAARCRRQRGQSIRPRPAPRARALCKRRHRSGRPAQMKQDDKLRHIPVIMISAVDDMESVIRCIELGAEDYLAKPFNPTLLRARVGASLERKRLHDQVTAQAADLAAWNYTLEQRVEQQLCEIERVSRLKRFLSPQVTELILSSGDERVLQSHRRAITV